MQFAFIPFGDTPRPTALNVPVELTVPAGQVLALRLFGSGVQVYRCDPRPNTPGAFGWKLTGPQATLRSFEGPAGRHYAGPTWEAPDGSKVVGQVVASARSPSGDGVDWLLLKAVSATGPGAFAGVSYVRRLGTFGGLPPTAECSVETAGRTAPIPYSASYEFYRPRP